VSSASAGAPSSRSGSGISKPGKSLLVGAAGGTRSGQRVLSIAVGRRSRDGLRQAWQPCCVSQAAHSCSPTKVRFSQLELGGGRPEGDGSKAGGGPQRGHRQEATGVCPLLQCGLRTPLASPRRPRVDDLWKAASGKQVRPCSV